MQAPSIKALVAEVRKVMPRIPKRINSRVSAQAWAPPPLVLRGARLGAVELAPFTDVSHGSFDDVRGVWEEYIHYYVAELAGLVTPPRDYLIQKLGLQSKFAAWLLPPHIFNDNRAVLAVLLSIASLKAGVEIDFSGGGVVLTHGDVRMGIEPDGTLLSRFVKDIKFEPGYDFKTMLTEQLPPPVKRTSVCAGFVSFYREAGAIEDRATRDLALLALRVLYFRYERLGRLTNYLYAKPSERTRKRMVSHLTGRIFELNNPMPLIHQTLVGEGWIDEQEFSELFRDGAMYKALAPEVRVDTDLITEWFETIRRMRN